MKSGGPGTVKEKEERGNGKGWKRRGEPQTTQGAQGAQVKSQSAKVKMADATGKLQVTSDERGTKNDVR